MLTKKEIKLIKLIKFAPVFIVSLLCVIITLLLYIEKNITLKKDLVNIEAEYLQKNQAIVKDEIEKVYNYIVHKKQNSESELRTDIKNRVLEAHNIMNFIYEKYKDIETKEEITTRIKDSLKALRFNEGRGYFYIFDMDGKNILHPLNEDLENTFITNHSDSFRVKSIEEVINDLKGGDESYNEYFWNKPNSKDLKKEYKKITFNKVFKPYNWYLGTGEYLEDFEEKTRKQILDYINTIRYSTNGYIFVIDKEGTYLAHVKKSYIGLNRINLKDPNGFMITKEIINMASKGEGFVKYVGTIKPETKLPSEKISFVKGFKDWEWAIATGFYTDELQEQIINKEKEYKKNYLNSLTNLFIASGILTLLFLFLSFYLSKRLENRFYKYKKQVINHIKRDKEKDNMLAQQSKMAAMGEMLENIAHQWRQPLSSISTISTGIKLQYEFGDIEKEQIINSMDSIATTTKYLSQTIDDFREYFNPNKEASDFNVKNMFEKAFYLVENQLNKNNIHIVKELIDCDIYGYENEFLQVLLNIINNSKDEFEKKEMEEKLILVNIEKLEGIIKISIKDNAGGIKEDIINKVFEPYFTTKFKSQGTGIGLYMSRQIVEKHMKGQLLVSNDEFIYENKNYVGAKFDIMFPLNSKNKEEEII